MLLQADTANGVQWVDEHDGELMDDETFFASLRDLADGELIFCEAGPEMVRRINEEYGIR